MRVFCLFVGLAAVAGDAITAISDRDFGYDCVNATGPGEGVPDCTCMYKKCVADGMDPSKNPHNPDGKAGIWPYQCE